MFLKKCVRKLVVVRVSCPEHPDYKKKQKKRKLGYKKKYKGKTPFEIVMRKNHNVRKLTLIPRSLKITKKNV